MTWPIGRGKDFAGTYNLAQNTIRRLDEEVEATPVSGPEDKLFDELLSQYDVDEWREEVELARDGLRPFDLAAFREGHLSPVFFGSALRNFGVRDLIDSLGAIAPPPRAQEAEGRMVEADERKMTGFIFKIQANMDPKTTVTASPSCASAQAS